jgi:propanol-preferring alcohol dehydrogenase
MRAMQAAAAGPIESSPLRLVDIPVPQPGEGEVRVRVACCGVCLTDLHVVEGDLPWRGPIVPGHQVVGSVDACGPRVTRVRLGQRVGVPWLRHTCGACRYCAGGRENLCEQAVFTGYDANGGFAEYVVAPADHVYELPDELDAESAAPLLCAGIIGYRALRLSGVKTGERLGIYGFGSSAHITIQVAIHNGIEVLVFTRSDSHRRLARELGASWVGRAEDDPPAGPHGSIVFAPAGPIVREALRVLERGGTVALAGIHMSPIPELEYRKHLYNERGVRSVSNNTREDGRALLAAAAAIPVRTRTQCYPLEEANAALLAVKHAAIDGAAVLRVASGSLP